MGSPIGVGAMPTVTPLTLSSAVKASLFEIMSWRCLAQSEHGIARPRTWHALGGFQPNVEPNPNRTMPWSARRLLSTRLLTRAQCNIGLTLTQSRPRDERAHVAALASARPTKGRSPRYRRQACPASVIVREPAGGSARVVRWVFSVVVGRDRKLAFAEPRRLFYGRRRMALLRCLWQRLAMASR